MARGKTTIPNWRRADIAAMQANYQAKLDAALRAQIEADRNGTKFKYIPIQPPIRRKCK